jgi:hypothetical protein
MITKLFPGQNISIMLSVIMPRAVATCTYLGVQLDVWTPVLGFQWVFIVLQPDEYFDMNHEIAP